MKIIRADSVEDHMKLRKEQLAYAVVELKQQNKLLRKAMKKKEYTYLGYLLLACMVLTLQLILVFK